MSFIKTLDQSAKSLWRLCWLFEYSGDSSNLYLLLVSGNGVKNTYADRPSNTKQITCGLNAYYVFDYRQKTVHRNQWDGNWPGSMCSLTNKYHLNSCRRETFHSWLNPQKGRNYPLESFLQILYLVDPLAKTKVIKALNAFK